MRNDDKYKKVHLPLKITTKTFISYQLNIRIEFT